MIKTIVSYLLVLLCSSTVASLGHAELWYPDTGNSEYRNPIIYADYSDPDVIRVGDDYFMVSSSFNVMPGIPVLHSTDLLHWRIIGHVYQNLPLSKYDKPAHGEGSWAPSIRFHNGLFYVYFCTPHDGLFVATTKDPASTWALTMIEKVELWEDPAPFWDDDGQAYLVRGKVRADNLYLHKMSADGMRLLDDGVIIYRDTEHQPTIEGPKMFKKDGWYYISAPAGGVQTGWQTLLRAKMPYGPYEAKTVLHQGNTDINGPHQGGLVEAQGQWWFLHYQDRGYLGRIVHMQPVNWQGDWPVFGVDRNNDGIGEPVVQWKSPKFDIKPNAVIPQTSDDFSGDNLGLQWQWHANPKASWYSQSSGRLRLNMVKNPTQNGNLRFVPNLFLQKISAPNYTATTKMRFSHHLSGDKSGLLVMGKNWGYLSLFKDQSEVKMGVFSGSYEQYDDATKLLYSRSLRGFSIERDYYLRVRIDPAGQYQFSFSDDGKKYFNIGPQLQAEAGVWIGAKVGLFALNPSLSQSTGFAEFDWFQVE